MWRLLALLAFLAVGCRQETSGQRSESPTPEQLEQLVAEVDKLRLELAEVDKLRSELKESLSERERLRADLEAAQLAVAVTREELKEALRRTVSCYRAKQK